jgi:hypothetical protein
MKSKASRGPATKIALFYFITGGFCETIQIHLDVRFLSERASELPIRPAGSTGPKFR